MGRSGEITAQEQIRRRRGFTVTGLAERTRFSHSYVSLVESGKLRPSARYRAAIAEALGVPEAVVFPEYVEPDLPAKKVSRS